MSTSVKFDGQGITDGLMDFETKAQAALRMYAETAAQKLEGSARENAPWTDRTSAARNRLNCKVEDQGNGAQLLALSHGVDYGLWLELAHEKNYAILQPTINKEGPEILSGLSNLLQRM